MEWKTLGTTFVLVFLAELGDKTQLATMGLATTQDSKWAVFMGSAVALVAASALAVLAGAWLSRWVSPVWIQRGAAALFIVLGAALLYEAR